MDENNEEILQDEENEMNDDDKFLKNINSTLYVKKNYDLKEYDYEWLDKLEDTIPYIDNILRNPRRFIVNEEEIVKVELSRKVTVESVIHLTQHTNLIQKIEDNGDVKPSKILNINKEESIDTYENRFIYTLINNLRMFFEDRVVFTSGPSYCVDKNVLKYEANSKVNGQDLKISLNINDVTKNIKEKSGGKAGLTYDERVSKIKKQIDSFMGSELHQTLSRLHVPPVRSPIRKTNVILKNPNFRKAEELWNYIQSFESKDKREKENNEYYDKGDLKGEYDQTFLMTFIANRNYISKGTQSTESNIMNQMIQRLIDNLLDTDEDLTEDKLSEIFKKQLSIIKKKNEQRRTKIYNILADRFERENKSISDLLELFKKEV